MTAANRSPDYQRITPEHAARSGPTIIFVYGTLMRGGRNVAWWPQAPRRVSSAWVQGALLDCGGYPGLVEGDDAVRGECWWFEQSQLSAVLARLDVLEDHRGLATDLYQRQRLVVHQVGGALLTAWGYRWRRQRAAIPMMPFAVTSGATDLTGISQAGTREMNHRRWVRWSQR